MRIINKGLFVLFFALSTSSVCFTLNNDYLYPRDIGASSYLLKNNYLVKDNYHPYYVLDDNPNTAWVEGSSGDGIGEYIILYCNLPKGKDISILVRNGYQKTEELFYQNNRVKEIDVRLISGTTDDPKIISHTYSLKDEMGWQQLAISPEEDSWEISFTIKSIYKGTKYNDTCISDIKIPLENLGFIDRNSQNELQDKYNKWFTARSKKAAFFKNLPKNYPFKQYQRTKYKKHIEGNPSSSDIEFFAKLFNNLRLKRFVSSPKGIKCINILESKTFNREERCNISSKIDFYLPEVLSENIFLDINEYISLSNLTIINDKSKPRKDDVIIKKMNIGKNATLIDWRILLENNYERLISRYYYDKEGRLFFIKGQYSVDDGEDRNDALFIWKGEKITEIYWFYICADNNGGLDVEMTVYE